MIRLTIILGFLTTLSWGQTSLDYKLYSTIIEDYVDEGIKHSIRTTEVLIITKYVPNENQVSFYGKEFLESDDQMINMTLRYDSAKVRLFKDEYVRKAIRTLENEFFQTPMLNERNFTVKPTAKVITNKKFQSFFKTIFGRQIDKGWRKFYKKYPGAHGIFEFSKIIYEGEFACFYVGHHSNGLSGSGDLVLMKKYKGNWEILTYMNIWVA